MLTMNVLQLGVGMHIDPGEIDTHGVAMYAAQAKSESVSGFLLNIVPDSVVAAFAKGDILQVLLFSILFGFALNLCLSMEKGNKARSVLDFIEKLEQIFFKLVDLILKWHRLALSARLLSRWGNTALPPCSR